MNLWLGGETAGKLARRGRSLSVCVHANAARVHAKLRAGYKERIEEEKKESVNIYCVGDVCGRKASYDGVFSLAAG